VKKLSIIVHTSQQQELADLLRSLQLDSFMFSHIEEHSAQLESDALLSARDRVVGYVPKVRVDVILEDDRARTLLGEIRNSGVSFKGKGIYWINEVEEAGEL
jgi:nitrogen regulatory protein P-II 1